MIQHVRSLRNVIPGAAEGGPGRRPLLGALFLAGTLLLAACGSGADDEAFTLNVVPSTAQITAGGSTDVAIELDRDADFDDVVTVTVTGLPEGVDAGGLSIDGDEGTLLLTAAPDAAPTMDAAEVVVTGTAGDETDEDSFDLTVEPATGEPGAEPGDPDSVFGTEGLATYSFEGIDAAVHDVEVLDDDSMIVAGSTTEGSTPLLVVARLDADGNLVDDFGDADPARGFTTIELAGTVQALDMSVDTTNDMIAVAAVTASGTTRTFELEHLSFGASDAADGTVDAGVSSDVIIQDAIDALHTDVADAEMFVDAYDVDFVEAGTDPELAGDVLVAGSAHLDDDGETEFGVVRFDSDGTIDGSFSDTDGIVAIDFGGGDHVAYGLEVLGEAEGYGMIVFGSRSTGTTTSGVAVLVSEGGGHVRDETVFGGSDFEVDLDAFAAVYDAVVTTDGTGDTNVIVAGETPEAGGSTDAAIGRFDVAGVLDPDFGDAGEVTDAFAGSGAITELAVNGAVVVAAGTTDTESGTHMVVARYDAATGAIDEAFGNAGYAVTAFDASAGASVHDLEVDDDRIIVGGSATDADGQEGALAAFVY